MSEKKPITEKGLILYKDYEFIFNFLSKEEIGEVVSTLLHTMDNPTLNPSDNDRVNNAYNYIANRIIDYKEKRDKVKPIAEYDRINFNLVLYRDKYFKKLVLTREKDTR